MENVTIGHIVIYDINHNFFLIVIQSYSYRLSDKLVFSIDLDINTRIYKDSMNWAFAI